MLILRNVKLSKISKDKFSKTLSLPVQTWAHLEEVRSWTRMPDLAIALQDCIDSKYDAMVIVKKLEESKIHNIEER